MSCLGKKKLTNLSKTSKFLYDKSVSKELDIISLTVQEDKGLAGTATKTITIK